MWLLILLILVIVLILMVRRGAISVNTGSSDVKAKDSKSTSYVTHDIEDEYIPDWDDPYFEGQRDKKFLATQDRYFALIQEIEADYTVFSNMDSPSDDVYIKIENKCVEAGVLFQFLVPLWEKYDRGVPESTPAFKRLAMIREKRGDYEGAALACVQQLRLGVQGDGTKGGMRGRLARMVKKGKLAETHPEAMKEITQYLEIK